MVGLGERFHLKPLLLGQRTLLYAAPPCPHQLVESSWLSTSTASRCTGIFFLVVPICLPVARQMPHLERFARTTRLATCCSLSGVTTTKMLSCCESYWGSPVRWPSADSQLSLQHSPPCCRTATYMSSFGTVISSLPRTDTSGSFLSE